MVLCQTHNIYKVTSLIVLLTLTVFVSVLTGILHGAGLWQFPKQLYLPTQEKSAQAPNSHLKYVWYDPAGSFSALEMRHVFLPLLFLASLGSAVLPLIICCRLV